MRTNRVIPIESITINDTIKQEDRETLLRIPSTHSRKRVAIVLSQQNTIVDAENGVDTFETIDLDESSKPVKLLGQGAGTYIRYIDTNTTTYDSNCKRCNISLHPDNVVQYSCTHNLCAICTRIYRRNARTMLCAICWTDIDWIAIQSVNIIHLLYATNPSLPNKSNNAVICR